MEAADASFNISIDSMSSGFKSEIEEIFCPLPTEAPCKSNEVEIPELLSLIIGIPSTT